MTKRTVKIKETDKATKKIQRKCEGEGNDYEKERKKEWQKKGYNKYTGNAEED